MMGTRKDLCPPSSFEELEYTEHVVSSIVDASLLRTTMKPK
jgi:hypothetical protein